MKKLLWIKDITAKTCMANKLMHNKLSFQGIFGSISSTAAAYIFLQCSFAIPFYFKAYIHL